MTKTEGCWGEAYCLQKRRIIFVLENREVLVPLVLLSTLMRTADWTQLAYFAVTWTESLLAQAQVPHTLVPILAPPLTSE